MMVTVCISTDGLSSVLISPNLFDNNSFHKCCWSIMPVTAIDIADIDCGLVTVSLFRRVAHHGESKMAAQANKSSSDRDGKNLCGRLFWETDALNK